MVNSVLSPLFSFRTRKYNFVSSKCDLELLGAVEGRLFCMGGYLGKGKTLD